MRIRFLPNVPAHQGWAPPCENFFRFAPFFTPLIFFSSPFFCFFSGDFLSPTGVSSLRALCRDFPETCVFHWNPLSPELLVALVRVISEFLSISASLIPPPPTPIVRLFFLATSNRHSPFPPPKLGPFVSCSGWTRLDSVPPWGNFPLDIYFDFFVQIVCLMTFPISTTQLQLSRDI